MKSTYILLVLWFCFFVIGQSITTLYQSNGFMFVIGVSIQAVGLGIAFSNVIISFNKENS
jgi:hypothetical protein